VSAADPPTPVYAVRVRVTGRVQGVAFRWHARELGVVGWVQNLEDGSVEAHVEGAREAVEALIAWLHEGPALSRVERVTTVAVCLEGGASFVVRT